MKVEGNAEKRKNSLKRFMRSLHRDIGFLVIGLTIIFCISGILLIYRDTDFLKQEKTVKSTIDPNLQPTELGNILHIKNFNVIRIEGDMVYFENGTYNRTTGITEYTTKVLPKLLSKMNGLHKAMSGNLVHWFILIYGILLLFLALSSFWMFNVRSKLFKRGIYFTAGGIVAAIIILIL